MDLVDLAWIVFLAGYGVGTLWGKGWVITAAAVSALVLAVLRVLELV